MRKKVDRECGCPFQYDVRCDGTYCGLTLDYCCDDWYEPRHECPLLKGPVVVEIDRDENPGLIEDEQEERGQRGTQTQ